VAIKCQIMLLKTDKIMLGQIKLGVFMLFHIVDDPIKKNSIAVSINLSV